MERAIRNIKCFVIGLGLACLIAFSVNASAGELHTGGDITMTDSEGGHFKSYTLDQGVEYTVSGYLSETAGNVTTYFGTWWSPPAGSFSYTFIHDGSEQVGFWAQYGVTTNAVISNISVYPTASPPDEEPTDPNAEVGVPLDLATFNQTTVDNQKIWTASFMACAFMLGVIAGRFR